MDSPDAGDEIGRKGFLKIEGEVLRSRKTDFQFNKLHKINVSKLKFLSIESLYLLPVKLFGGTGVDSSEGKSENPQSSIILQQIFNNIIIIKQLVTRTYCVKWLNKLGPSYFKPAEQFS